MNANQQAQTAAPKEAKPQPAFPCPSCACENRPVAKYCRFCGKAIPEPAERLEQAAGQNTPTAAAQQKSPEKQPALPAGDYIGLETVRAELERVQKHITFQRERAKHGVKSSEGASIFIFRGNTGTGKTLVAGSFIKELKKAKCLESDSITTISARALSRQYKDEFALANFLAETKPAALVVDDAAEDKPFLHELLLALGKAKQNCVCVLLGSGEALDEFFKNYPEDKQRVSRFFEFPDPSTEELSRILEKKLREKNYRFDPALSDSFTAYIEERRHDPRCEHKNGWLVEKDIVPAIEKNQEERLSKQDSLSGDDYKTILEADTPLKNKKRTVDEILADLDRMIGLTEVKKAVRTIAQAIEMQKERKAKGLQGNGQAIHIVFTGNPGTGKTTVAHRLGQLFHAMGLLPSDKVIEVDRSKLVAGFVGQTAPQVNKACDDAMGGILFIDEAYDLIKEDSSKDYGLEVITTLLTRMENDRGKFVVIAAGYEHRMETFLQANDGLKSRFTHFLHLADYKPDELFAIYVSMAKQNGYTFTGDAQESAKQVIDSVYRRRGQDFANGRTMRNLFDETKRRLAGRIASLSKEERANVLTLITADDIPRAKSDVEGGVS